MPEQTIWRMDSGRETGMIILNLLTHWPNYLEVQALSSLLFCLVGTVMNFMIKSLYFNIQLEQLCARLGCKYVDLSNDILELDNGFYCDGLHLSATGKAFFPYSLDLFLIHCFDLKKSTCMYMCKSRSWIPKELTKLWTPKPEKPKKKHQKETDRDCFINKRRERKEKWLLRRRRRPKNSCKLPHNHTQSGFQTAITTKCGPAIASHPPLSFNILSTWRKTAQVRPSLYPLGPGYNYINYIEKNTLKYDNLLLSVSNSNIQRCYSISINLESLKHLYMSLRDY